MVAYVCRVWKVNERLRQFWITHIPCFRNRQLNALSKLASSSTYEKPKEIHWEMLF